MRDPLALSACRWLAPVIAGASWLFAPACVDLGGGGGGGGGHGGNQGQGTSSSASSAGGSRGAVPAFQPCKCDSVSILEGDGPCPPSVTCDSAELYCTSGLCRPGCIADADCPAGSRCNGLYCTEPCTPLPDSCPKGTVCTLTGSSDDCLSRSGAASQDGCYSDADCPVGTTCQGDTAHEDGACDRWCRLGQGGDCDAGTTCVGFDTPLLMGGVTFGACRTDCDPTQPCAGGGRCDIETALGVTFTDCLPAGMPTGRIPCATERDCAPGTTCRLHTLNATSCEPYCALPDGPCPNGTTCTPLPTSPVVGGVSYGTCAEACDPLSSTSCGAGASCAVVTDTPGGAAFTDCVEAGTGVGPFGCVGDASLCAPGTQCTAFPIGPESLYACETYCRVGPFQDCPAQRTCAALVPPVTIGGVGYGVCQEDCNLVTPADVCGADATCLPVLDGTSPPHTACAGVPDVCQIVLDPDGDPMVVCTSSSSLPLGAACVDDTGCPPGSTCQQGGCFAWCELGPSGQCPGGGVCTPETPPLTIDGVTYGTCQ